METSFPLLTSLVALPALGALALRGTRQVETMRRVALGAAALTLGLAAVLALAMSLGGPGAAWNEPGFRVPGLGMEYRLGVDGLSVLALALTALLGFGLVAAGPRQSLDPSTLGALLLTESATLGFFCARDLALMLLFFAATLVPTSVLVTRGARLHPASRALRTFRAYMVAGTLPLLGATVLVGVLGGRAGVESPYLLPALIARGVPEPWHIPLFALLLLAVGVRMAVVPFHSWLPVLLARGPFGLGPLLVNVHMGVYLLVRVVMPLLPGEWNRASLPLLALGLAGALYGALLAVAQTDLRRMVGCFMVSQSGLLLAGLATGDRQSVTGVLVQSVAVGLALTGLQLVVRALEARTGTTDLTRLGGLVRQGPRMAAFFFLLGFGALGFPGTLSFVGEDLMLHGILDHHPLVALPMLLTTAINAITIFRAFQRTFLGAPAHGHAPVLETVEDLLPRERWVALALLALVVLGGVMPGPLLRLRESHVESLVERVALEKPAEGSRHAAR